MVGYVLHLANRMMKRRELFRRSLFGPVGAAIISIVSGRNAGTAGEARKFPQDHDASRELSGADWKPIFLDLHQNKTLIRLSDLIIPETNTPGAQTALTNRFIDRLLAAEPRDTQRESSWLA